MTWLYVVALAEQSEPIIKVGITGNLSSRLSELGTASPFALEVLASLAFPSRAEARSNEREIHRELKSFKLRGEWFHLDPVTLASLLDVMKQDAETVH